MTIKNYYWLPVYSSISNKLSRIETDGKATSYTEIYFQAAFYKVVYFHFRQIISDVIGT